MNRLFLLTLFWSIALIGLAKSTVPVVDTVFVQRYDTICQGDTLKLYGLNYIKTGRYQHIFNTVKPIGVTKVIINLWVRQKVKSERFDTLCQGEQLMVGNQQFSSAGTYSIVFPPYKIRCDSVVTLHLFILPIFTQKVRISICMGDTMQLGPEKFYYPAITTVRYNAKNGCDSIVLYQIDMLDTFRTQLAAVACKGARVKVGNTQITASNSGTFLYNFAPTAQRCDSLVELKLTVRDTFLTKVKEGICIGNTRQLGPLTLSQSGIYRYTFPSNQRRCDSTVVLDLRLIPKQEKNIQPEICQGDTLKIGPERFFRAGNYQVSLRTQAGCDSIINLNLRVRPSFRSNLSASICTGGQYHFGKRVLTQKGIYLDTLSSRMSGCDSIVRLDLQVESVESNTINHAICKGESYTFDGKNLRSAGVYIDTLRSTNVCPIIFELHLKVNPVFHDTIRATICQGEVYTFGLSNYGKAGFYPYRLKTTQGCDSIRYLQLKVLPSYRDTMLTPICAGDTFRFGQLKFFKEGLYPIRFNARNGCDSSLVVKIVHYPLQQDTFPVSLCAGDTFRLGRLKFFQTGMYPISLRDQNSCDSTLYIQVTRQPIYQLNVTQAICGGRSLRFGTQIISRTGLYTETFRSRAGCDSVVTLRLNMEQVDTSIAQGGILLNASTASNIRRYEWIDCVSQQVVSRLSSPFFLPERNGRYAVRLYTDTCVYTSGCHSVQLSTAARQIDFSKQILVHPNPTVGRISVVVPTQLQGLHSLDWYSAEGRLLRREKVRLNPSNNFDLSGFPGGLYLLHIRDAEGKAMALVKVFKTQQDY